LPATAARRRVSCAGPTRLRLPLGGGLLEQASNGRRSLRTLLLPIAEAVGGNIQALFLAGSERVVEADALDEAAIAARARISTTML
jgi:hypothetical protein